MLDKFVYDPNGHQGDVAISFAKGALRFVTGEIKNKQNVTPRTPIASMVIRGTVLVFFVPADGSAAALVNAGETVLAPIAGGGIRLDAPRPSPDPGIADATRVLIPCKKAIR